jgi:hypothetical protein
LLLPTAAKSRAFSSIAEPVSCMPRFWALRAQFSSARSILGELRLACLADGLLPPLCWRYVCFFFKIFDMVLENP